MAGRENAPIPPVIEDFPPSRPGLKFFGIVGAIVVAVIVLVFRQQVLGAIGMG